MGAPLFVNGTLAIIINFNTNFFLTLALGSVWCCPDSLVFQCFCVVSALFFGGGFFSLFKYLGSIKLINQMKTVCSR